MMLPLLLLVSMVTSGIQARAFGPSTQRHMCLPLDSEMINSMRYLSQAQIEKAQHDILVIFKGLLTGGTGVRLVGGSGPHEGRVELFREGQWGTVCDDWWGLDDAKVVCRMLGYRDAEDAKSMAHYGPGSGKIWLRLVECRGNEGSLDDCRHDGWGSVGLCSHREDAGVVCKV